MGLMPKQQQKGAYLNDLTNLPAHKNETKWQQHAPLTMENLI